MFDYFLSYLKPVKKIKKGEVVVIIRGITFKSESWEEIIKQIELELEFNRRKISDDMINAGYIMPSTSTRGKWNVGAIILRNTLKNIQAFETFLDKNK
ncbi:MAG: hypothetical protein K6T65_07150 [Peptococcaceae bacterium]|nr:hypothetical protein [Peptococcaceae bacterium]